MIAIVKTAKGHGNIELREIPEPQIQDDQVLIEIKAAGLCGSDLHHYEVGDRIATPVVLGHEFSGLVAAVGKRVEGWKVGDRIVSETHAEICERCVLCRTGAYYLCAERKGFGSGVNGAFTQYLAVPARLLHRVYDDFSYPEAALLQPTADIVHAVVRKTELNPGDTVVVLGPGPMGLLTAEVARAVGAGQVIVVGLDQDQKRLEIARQIGADHTINASREKVYEAVMDLTGGNGANVVFEVSGAKRAFVDGIKILAKKGQMTIIGIPNAPIEIDLRALQAAEQSIRSSVMSSWRDYEQAIQLARMGRIRLQPLITDVMLMTEWKRGFELALTKEACKVVFTPAD